MHKVSATTDSKLYRYKNEDENVYHLWSAEVSHIMHCPDCDRRYAQLKSSDVSHEVNGETSTMNFSGYCEQCKKWQDIQIFIWLLDDAVSFSITRRPSAVNTI